jgi:hypothetical protein
MLLNSRNRCQSPRCLRQVGLWAGVVVALALCEFASAATVKQKSFASPEEAVEALMAAGKNDDTNELLTIFGPAGKDLLFSGDAVADRQARERFIKDYDEKHRLVQEGNDTILVIGKNDWPFPVPLVKKGESWVFDTGKGKDEVLNRRIGQNELDAIQVCRAIVDAQREYALKDRDNDGLIEYATKFHSDPGKKNGLYWASAAGEEQSPLGPLVTQAKQEGYERDQASDKPTHYHGYYYRLLNAQGKNAPGGAYDYVVKGKMIGGFAVVAYPAEYGNSGVMTFIANHDGAVFQKDLGTETSTKAQAMRRFDPDKTWKKVD